MILITGATGLVGSHILFDLVKQNKPVRAIYRNKNHIEKTKRIFEFYDHEKGLSDHIEWIEADITDPHSLDHCMNDVRQVYHIAGKVTFDDASRRTLHHINAEGTANVVNICLEKGDVKLGYVSSIATLGEFDDNRIIDEKAVWNKGKSASAYALSKNIAEMEVWRGVYEGMEAVIVNPSVIIGPGMWMGPGEHLFKAILKGLKFYPPGSSGYVDVRDVASFMIRLMESQISGERFILNSGNITHLDFMTLLANELGSRPPVYPVSPLLARIAVTGEWLISMFNGSAPRINRRTFQISAEMLEYSNKKITDTLGMEFIPIKDSIRDAVEIFQKHSN